MLFKLIFHYIHLEIKSRDPKRLAEFYSNVMDMKINRLTNQKFLCEGPGRKIIIKTGKNKTLGYAGMVCKNEENLERYKEFLKINKCEINDFCFRILSIRILFITRS